MEHLDKTGDDDYYILTLAAIARELNVYGLTDAKKESNGTLPYKTSGTFLWF